MAQDGAAASQQTGVFADAQYASWIVEHRTLKAGSLTRIDAVDISFVACQMRFEFLPTIRVMMNNSEIGTSI
jgi:hypothetical protein